jgi:hypothetical protein
MYRLFELDLPAFFEVDDMFSGCARTLVMRSTLRESNNNPESAEYVPMVKRHGKYCVKYASSQRCRRVVSSGADLAKSQNGNNAVRLSSEEKCVHIAPD